MRQGKNRKINKVLEKSQKHHEKFVKEAPNSLIGCLFEGPCIYNSYECLTCQLCTLAKALASVSFPKM